MNFGIFSILFTSILACFVSAVADDSHGNKVKLAAAPPVRGQAAQKHGHKGGKKGTKLATPYKPRKNKNGHSSATSGSDSEKGRKHHHHKGSITSSTSNRSTITRSSARKSSIFDSVSQKCTLELEAIVYSPSSTVKEYMTTIANEIRADIQVIMAAFAGGNLEYLRTYTTKYGIAITLLGPFGNPVLVTSTFVAGTDFIQSVSLAQNYAGRDGFYVDTKTGYYNYEFTLMSSDGQLISFILSLPTSAMTNTPTNCNLKKK